MYRLNLGEAERRDETHPLCRLQRSIQSGDRARQAGSEEDINFGPLALEYIPYQIIRQKTCSLSIY